MTPEYLTAKAKTTFAQCLKREDNVLGRDPADDIRFRNSLLGNKIIKCNYCGKVQCVVQSHTESDRIVQYFKDQEDSIRFRLDVDPVPDFKPSPIVKVDVLQILNLLKNLLKRWI